MRLTVDHPLALADDRLSDGLDQVGFPGAGRAQKQSVLMMGDERGRRQIEDRAPIHLLVEVEIEVVERFPRVGELRLLPPSFQQPLPATSQFLLECTLNA